LKINCDKCNKKFSPEILKSTLKQGIYEVYFVCPHCDFKYHCYNENDQSVAIQDSINTVKLELTKVPKIKDYVKRFNTRQELLTKLKNLEEEKRKVFGKIN
jgi:hypothetical protein